MSKGLRSQEPQAKVGKEHFCTFDFKAQMLLENEASYLSGTENEDRPSDKD